MIGYLGKSVNKYLIEYALKTRNVLIIDCANAANPHKYYKYHESFHEVYVIEIELLYQYRDVMLRLSELAHGFSEVVITMPYALFNYQDEVENKNVMEHALEVAKGYKFPIKIGMKDAKLAKRYCEVIKWVTPFGVKELSQT